MQQSFRAPPVFTAPSGASLEASYGDVVKRRPRCRHMMKRSAESQHSAKHCPTATPDGLSKANHNPNTMAR